jgi:hypothetical protein
MQRILLLADCAYVSRYIQLLYEMRNILKHGKAYTQVPQLSSGRPMDLNQRFML